MYNLSFVPGIATEYSVPHAVFSQPSAVASQPPGINIKPQLSGSGYSCQTVVPHQQYCTVGPKFGYSCQTVVQPVSYHTGLDSLLHTCHPTPSQPVPINTLESGFPNASQAYYQHPQHESCAADSGPSPGIRYPTVHLITPGNGPTTWINQPIPKSTSVQHNSSVNQPAPGSTLIQQISTINNNSPFSSSPTLLQSSANPAPPRSLAFQDFPNFGHSRSQTPPYNHLPTVQTSMPQPFAPPPPASKSAIYRSPCPASQSLVQKGPLKFSAPADCAKMSDATSCHPCDRRLYVSDHDQSLKRILSMGGDYITAESGQNKFITNEAAKILQRGVYIHDREKPQEPPHHYIRGMPNTLHFGQPLSDGVDPGVVAVSKALFGGSPVFKRIPKFRGAVFRRRKLGDVSSEWSNAFVSRVDPCECIDPEEIYNPYEVVRYRDEDGNLRTKIDFGSES